MTFRSPELWFYLLGLSVLLVIALRRVLARQAPLSDELYSKTVAIEHVQSGVAWIRADGSMIHDMYLMQVKSPEKSNEPWDYYNVVETFKGESIWTTKAESKCTLWK